jgi:uncharacterized protein
MKRLSGLVLRLLGAKMNRSAICIISMLAMIASPAPADVKAGVDAWSRGDYAAAVKEWRQAAIAGDPDAQFNMGQAYKLGRGVPVDLQLAEDWYRRAALQGHLQAEDNYGLVMFQNGNRERALPFVEKSAARGEPRAQYLLGTALFNGDMVKKDWPRAYALMTRASALGLAPASASLAQMDKYIPLDQRQKGLILARDLEATASRPLLPPQGASRPSRTTSAINKEPVRPSTATEPVIIAGVQPNATKPVSKQPKPLPKPLPKPTPPAAAAKVEPSPNGKWRVQLGAFSDANKAGALWSALKNKVGALGGLQSYQVKAGAVTRLQAGPLASKAAADKVCGAVKAAGQACLPVGI